MISLFLGSSPAREPMSASGIEMAPWAWLASYASLLRTSTSTAFPLASAWRASAAGIRRAVSWVAAAGVFSAGAADIGVRLGGLLEPWGAAKAGAVATASSTPPASARPLRGIQLILEPPGLQPSRGGPVVGSILQPIRPGVVTEGGGELPV